MPNAFENATARYLAEAVETATPAVRLGMLWDRLELDMQRADNAFEAGDLFAINEHLVHAQDILLALADTLRTDSWEGARQLAALYGFIHGELVQANLGKDRSRAAAAAGLVRQLAHAWRSAIASQSGGPVGQVHGVA